MITRAHSILNLKSVDAGARVITGIASTPELDRAGDLVDPLGITFRNPVPLLLYHDTKSPVGVVTFDRPTSAGLTFRAELPDVDEPGPLRDRIRDAWQSIKAGLIRGVSIGFRPLDDGVERLKGGGLKFTKTEVLELSLVCVPANQGATIAAIKSADAAIGRASKGAVVIDARPRPHPPGDTGPSRRPAPTGVVMKIQNAERKAAFVAERTTKIARLNELLDTVDKTSTLDEAQQKEYDTLTDEVDAIDKHLSRIETADRLNAAAAVAVSGATADDGSQSRNIDQAPRPVAAVTVKSNTPPGIGFARVIGCKMAVWSAMQRGEGFLNAVEVAKSRYPDDPRIAMTLKATIGAANVVDPAWLGVLADPAGLAAEFVEYMRPKTIVGRIPGLTRVPFRVPIIGQTTAGTAYWVGEGKPKPLTKFALQRTTTEYAKVAVISVLTEELARFSSPSAEGLIRDELVKAITERIDIDFIDPTKAAVVQVSPASITNGVAPIPSAGNEPVDVRTDLNALIAGFADANTDISGAVLLMPSTLALTLGGMTNDLGQTEFPGVGMNGGAYAGIPIVTSQYLKRPDANGNMVVMVNAPDILLADDGQVSVDVSREAALEMDSAPTQAQPAGAALVSLWQNNLIGLRAERFISWSKRRPNAVAWLSAVDWGAPELP